LTWVNTQGRTFGYPVSMVVPPHRHGSAMRAKRIGIDTYQEPVVFMRADCQVCRSEGFEAQARVRISASNRSIIATLNVVQGALLGEDDAGLSEAAWKELDAHDGQRVLIDHAEPIESLSSVRAKIYGQHLNPTQIESVIDDIAAGHYSNIEIAAFLTACAGGRMNHGETVALTRAMVRSGRRLSWDRGLVVDKHCIGGLPGNRTTPIVVAIVAAAGLLMPKTSSRAITSPAGTADVMETLAPVNLDLEAMRRVVEAEGGCVVWGGGMALSPADDILIRVERPLDFDSNDQLVASVLSKKIAAGSTHVVIDIPVGPTAKVRSTAAARALAEQLKVVGSETGLRVRAIATDGSQPVGHGIGPALEARDVLAVLQLQASAPRDLRERALSLAAAVLEIAGRHPHGAAIEVLDLLESGAAWAKFRAICKAQGGMREPPSAPHRWIFKASSGGIVQAIENRKLARVAKLAGAPRAVAAGLELHTRIGSQVTKGQPLFTLHAEAPGELEYAAEYARRMPGIFEIGEQS
jgi:thymidine phosphorylase